MLASLREAWKEHRNTISVCERAEEQEQEQEGLVAQIKRLGAPHLSG